jgi:hypothetical protein
VLSRVDPLGYRLMAAVLRGGGAAADRPFCVFSGAWVPANKILLVLSLPAPITRQQVLCTIFSPIQRPTLYGVLRWSDLQELVLPSLDSFPQKYLHTELFCYMYSVLGLFVPWFASGVLCWFFVCPELVTLKLNLLSVFHKTWMFFST